MTMHTTAPKRRVLIVELACPACRRRLRDVTVGPYKPTHVTGRKCLCGVTWRVRVDAGDPEEGAAFVTWEKP